MSKFTCWLSKILGGKSLCKFWSKNCKDSCCKSSCDAKTSTPEGILADSPLPPIEPVDPEHKFTPEPPLPPIDPDEGKILPPLPEPIIDPEDPHKGDVVPPTPVSPIDPDEGKILPPLPEPIIDPEDPHKHDFIPSPTPIVIPEDPHKKVGVTPTRISNSTKPFQSKKTKRKPSGYYKHSKKKSKN